VVTGSGQWVDGEVYASSVGESDFFFFFIPHPNSQFVYFKVAIRFPEQSWQINLSTKHSTANHWVLPFQTCQSKSDSGKIEILAH